MATYPLLHSYEKVTQKVLERNGVTLEQLFNASPLCEKIMKKFGVRNIGIIFKAVNVLHIDLGDLFSYQERATPIVLKKEMYNLRWTDRYKRLQARNVAPVYVGEKEFASLKWAQVCRYLTKLYYPTLFNAFNETERITINKGETLYSILLKLDKQTNEITADEMAKIVKQGYYDKPTDKLAFYSMCDGFYLTTSCKNKFDDYASIFVKFSVLLDARHGKDVWDSIYEETMHKGNYTPEEIWDTPEAKTLHTLLDRITEKAKARKH